MIVIAFAGPNGSGKSTLISSLEKYPHFPGNFVSPDEIAKTEELMKIVNYDKRSQAAADIATELRYLLLNENEDFAFESVFSHPSKLEFLKEAKALGYTIESIFVTTKDPQMNIDRVAHRVANGGHDVPVDKIRPRYERSLALLPELIEISDYNRVYDNSDESPFIVFRKHQEIHVLLNKEKRYEWVDEKLINPLKEMNIIDHNVTDLSVEETEEFNMRLDFTYYYDKYVNDCFRLPYDFVKSVMDRTFEKREELTYDEIVEEFDAYDRAQESVQHEDSWDIER